MILNIQLMLESQLQRLQKTKQNVTLPSELIILLTENVVRSAVLDNSFDFIHRSTHISCIPDRNFHP